MCLVPKSSLSHALQNLMLVDWRELTVLAFADPSSRALGFFLTKMSKMGRSNILNDKFF